MPAAGGRQLLPAATSCQQLLPTGALQRHAGRGCGGGPWVGGAAHQQQHALCGGDARRGSGAGGGGRPGSSSGGGGGHGQRASTPAQPQPARLASQGLAGCQQQQQPAPTARGAALSDWRRCCAAHPCGQLAGSCGGAVVIISSSNCSSRSSCSCGSTKVATCQLRCPPRAQAAPQPGRRGPRAAPTKQRAGQSSGPAPASASIGAGGQGRRGREVSAACAAAAPAVFQGWVVTRRPAACAPAPLLLCRRPAAAGAHRRRSGAGSCSGSRGRGAGRVVVGQAAARQLRRFGQAGGGARGQLAAAAGGSCQCWCLQHWSLRWTGIWGRLGTGDCCCCWGGDSGGSTARLSGLLPRALHRARSCG